MLVLQRQYNSRMFRIDTRGLVLVFISIWLAFGRRELHRHKAYLFELEHNKGFEPYSLGCGAEVLSGLSYLSGFSHFLV